MTEGIFDEAQTKLRQALYSHKTTLMELHATLCDFFAISSMTTLEFEIRRENILQRIDFINYELGLKTDDRK